MLPRERNVFHLSALEATYIKTLKPILCRQKETVYSLHFLIFFMNMKLNTGQYF